MMNKRNLKWIFGGLSIALVVVTVFFVSNAAMAQDEADPTDETKIENVQDVPTADADAVDCAKECSSNCSGNCTKEECENCMSQCKSSCELGGDLKKDELEEGDC